MTMQNQDKWFSCLKSEEIARYREFMRMWLEIDQERLQWLLQERTKTEQQVKLAENKSNQGESDVNVWMGSKFAK